jgi:hypothetical protein
MRRTFCAWAAEKKAEFSFNERFPINNCKLRSQRE